MKDKPSVLRPTDDEARQLARQLMAEAPWVALAVLEPATGWPSISRTIIALDEDGVPFILVSALAAHTGALKTDGRCSFLAGEPGKGDPLAYPRLSVQAQAFQVTREHPDFPALRDRFLNRHPKAQLYIDLPDFCFFCLMPQSGSLNGGFGKAFRLEGQDLVGRA